MGLMNAKQYQEFRERIAREEERRNKTAGPIKSDWTDKMDDELEKYPILPPRLRRRVNPDEK